MNTSTTLALLAKYTDLTQEDAERISNELEHSVQPATYKDAVHLVDKVAGEAKRKRKSSIA